LATWYQTLSFISGAPSNQWASQNNKQNHTKLTEKEARSNKRFLG